MATLGISTNTRLLAVAIINSGRLLDYSIHLHKQPWSPSKANLIINNLEACARRYSIKNVVLSIPHEYHQTKALRFLLSRICKHFKKKAITVTSQNVTAFYSLCPSEQKKTKKTLMETVVKLFPELNYCYLKEQRNKNKYYIKLFEAVAAAAVHDVD